MRHDGAVMSPVESPSRAVRVWRAVAAGLVLVALVLGVPVLLATIARPDLSAWAGRSWVDILFRPDDGGVLLLVLTVAAWLVWGLFTLCVVVEVVNLLVRRSRPVRLPGLGLAQGLAAALVVAVLAVVLSPGRTTVGTVSAGHLAADPGSAVLGVTAPSAPEASPVRDDAPRPGSQLRKDILAVHEVVRGDDLWSLAEHYYSDGSSWRRIASANAVMAAHGPDDLEVGWRLVIPTLQGGGEGPYVVAVAGDTLSGLSARHLGGADRWPELFRANRLVLSDPDELEIGTVLQLPSLGRPSAAASTVQLAAPESVVTPPAPTDADETSRTGRDAPARTGASRHQVITGHGEPVLQVAGISGMLAAAILGGVAGRRLQQLHERPLGRRISQPTPLALRAGQELATRQRPDRLTAIDRAMRLVAAWARDRGGRVPRLLSVRVGATLALELATVTPDPPAPFRATGRLWEIEDLAGWLASPDLWPDEVRPWPATVTIGTTTDPASPGSDIELLVNLEEVGVLGLHGSGTQTGVSAPARSALVALACALSFQPWSRGTRVTLLADTAEAEDLAWAAALDAPELFVTNDTERVLDRMSRRATEQRAADSDLAQAADPEEEVGPHDLRLDPVRGEAWAAEVLVVLGDLAGVQRSRLLRLVSEGDHPSSLAAVLPGRDGAAARLEIDGDGLRARLSPLGVTCRPQLLDAGAAGHLAGLLVGTAGPTRPAPWWSGVPVSYRPQRVAVPPQRRGGSPEPFDPTASMLGVLPARAADGSILTGPGIGENGRTTGSPGEEVTAVSEGADEALTHLADPVVLLIGPVDLVGARGTAPSRARKQCIEYCAWLLEHPGRTASAMADALVVAEGTRRSNMSRLRTWLGEGSDGPYLPDAYSGRISLHDSVSSDWQRLQMLVAGGVDRASTSALVAALELVRGAPLADAAPLQWMWAEELRTDIISVIRDIGVELSDRALADGDRDLAGWAAARALTAAAGDELLQCARIRVEHASGRRAEVERLALQLAAQARRLEIDLADETVALLQQVMEGATRARIGTTPLR